MAVGYLDLLQRELRNAVPHPFASVAELAATTGSEGQIASADGSFYIFTAGVWKRIVNEVDLAVVEAKVASKAGVYKQVIADIAVNPLTVTHGFAERPMIEVSGPDGNVLDVQVTHGDGAAVVAWSGPLPVPSVVTCIGVPADG